MLLLAPLRGVTIRTFREVFAKEIVEAGFEEAITPFITAISGFNPLKDRELSGGKSGLPITPQFIGKDPAAFRECLKRVREAGYKTADLNCGCPYPMVRNKGRGSGLMRTPDVLRRMLEVGCEEMGAGNFSVKTRLGVERSEELLSLLPLINQYPLRFLTVHGRVAKQMYEGKCDEKAMAEVIAAAKVPIILNGDLTVGEERPEALGLMVGRSFIRSLGERENIRERLKAYIEVSRTELSGERPVLGRIKELVAYWQDSPRWHRHWQTIKLVRTIEELRAIL